MDDNHKWPELPKVLRAQHAYGVLEVLTGEITQEDREIMDPEELEDMPKEGDVRHSMLARVNLDTGELFTEEYLSRDGYDWGIDTIVFRPYCSAIEIHPEEGQRSEFSIEECDLEKVKKAWLAYLASEQNRAMGEETPQAGLGRAGPRL